MSCPYLKEVVMLFCDGYPQKKLLPLDRLATANPCLGEYRDCTMFKECMARAAAPAELEFHVRPPQSSSRSTGKERPS